MRREKGITLIALVITIIVLLILATVSIAILTGENGILTKAGGANEETRGAGVEEARRLWEINQEADKSTENGTAQTLEELLNDLENQKLITPHEKKTIKETGEVTIGSRTIVFKEKEITDCLKAGDYVKYIDKKGSEIKCRVLYDKAYDAEKGTNYGLQIVAENSVGTVKLGYEDPNLPIDIASQNKFEKAKWSYNNAIKTLNDIAETYRNPKYTDEGKARCVGSVPDNPNAEASDYFNEIYKNTDVNYEKDWNQLGVIGSLWKSYYYWLASRVIKYDGSRNQFYVRAFSRNRFVECYHMH